jgi:hypothetical protein
VDISDLSNRLIKLETDLPYVKGDIQEIWSAFGPMTRDHEELKTEIIRYLNRLEIFDKDLVSIKDTVKAHSLKIVDFDEQYKFLVNARKNINTIFVAIIIQTIFLISGLLAFVFTLTQQKANNSQYVPNNGQQQQIVQPVVQSVVQPVYPRQRNGGQ